MNKNFGLNSFSDGLMVFEVAGEVEGVLADEPVAVAALFPFGKIGRVDGLTVEFGGQNGADFQQGVEPFEEGLAFFAVAKAAVELVAEVVGEAGDFTGAG